MLSLSTTPLRVTHMVSASLTLPLMMIWPASLKLQAVAGSVMAIVSGLVIGLVSSLSMTPSLSVSLSKGSVPVTFTSYPSYQFP